MSDLTTSILNEIGSQGLAQLAGGLGTDQDSIQRAAAMAIPAILAGMGNNSRQPAGATALAGALDDHSGSILGNLGALLGDDRLADGAKILGHVLGGQRGAVEQNVAQQSGLNLNLIMKLLPILAPIVMGYLSKQKQQQGLDAGSLAQILAQDRQVAEQQQPGLGGLAAILDTVIESLDDRR